MNAAGVPKTQYIVIQGKCKFLRTNCVPNEYDAWDYLHYPNEEGVGILRKMQDGWLEDVEGIANELKQDEDGYFMRFRRPSLKKTRANKIITFVPPIITEADGKTPYLGLIGNGSDVTTTVELYFYKNPRKPGKFGSAIRWQSTRIDNLVVYEGDRDMNDQDKKLIKSLDRVAVPAW